MKHTSHIAGNCKYAECSLQAWSAWSDLSSPISNDHCASQERRKRYRLTWKYVERRDNCNHGLPTSCPTDVVETREKGLDLKGRQRGRAV